MAIFGVKSRISHVTAVTAILPTTKVKTVNLDGIRDLAALVSNIAAEPLLRARSADG